MYSVLGQGYVTSPYNDIQAKHTQMNNVLLLHPRFSIGLTQDLRNLLHPPNNWHLKMQTSRLIYLYSQAHLIFTRFQVFNIKKTKKPWSTQ